MVNKINSYKILAGFICCLLIFASCNLPQQGTQVQVTAVPENTGPETNETDDSDGLLIERARSEEWREPDAGPTVTPIVLSIEKQGKDLSSIISIDQNLPVVYSEGAVQGQAATSTPVPAYVAAPAVLKDEMKVVSFAPFSGTVVLPNQALHLDVMLQNTGSTTWQTGYKVVDISSRPMTVQKEYYLPYAVAPGGTVLLSIYFASPSEMGTYPESFQIQDAYGAVFGQFDYSLTVGAFSSITEIPTLTATVTPTYYSADGITATPDELRWMCIDPERSKLQDCYSFCVEYSDREEFKYCFYNGERYVTPVP